jgi:hypothetical protein
VFSKNRNDNRVESIPLYRLFALHYRTAHKRFISADWRETGRGSVSCLDLNSNFEKTARRHRAGFAVRGANVDFRAARAFRTENRANRLAHLFFGPAERSRSRSAAARLADHLFGDEQVSNAGHTQNERHENGQNENRLERGHAATLTAITR